MNIGRALVVDDSKVVQFKLKRTLEARGMGVDTAASGQEALNFLKSHAPDVIFMDCVMPDMDGYEVTGMIKANPRTAAIPVVMCTGNDTPEDRERARQIGASGFIVKPFDDAVLDTLLANLKQAAAGPVAVPVSVVPAPAVAADTERLAEGVAREVAQKLVREAMASLSAAAEQAARDAAQQAAARVVQEAVAAWRAELAREHENAKLAAISAATQAARESIQAALREVQTLQDSAAMAAEDKLRDALAAVHMTAEHAARQTLDSAGQRIEAASRQMIESARVDIHEHARTAAESTARPIAETAARGVAEQLVNSMLGAAQEDRNTFRADVERAASTAAERVCREMLEQSTQAAEAARRAAEASTEAKLQEVLLATQAAAERVAREGQNSVHRVLEDSSRHILETIRADLQDQVQRAAEAAVKPAAETAVRAVAEQLALDKLDAAGADLLPARTDAAHAAIAPEQAERETGGYEDDISRAAGRSRSEADATTEATDLPSLPAPHAPAPEPLPSGGSVPPFLLPWLGGLTLLVLYLVFKSFS